MTSRQQPCLVTPQYVCSVLTNVRIFTSCFLDDNNNNIAYML